MSSCRTPIGTVPILLDLASFVPYIPVASKFYKRLKPGDIIRVRYLPDNPKMFDLIG